MAKAYLNRDDMRMRLHRCIVSWEGEPYFCDVDAETKEWYEVTLMHLEGIKGTKRFAVDHRDEKFSGASLPIGYFNHRGQAYYAVREASRKQNQGLHVNNVMVTPKIGGDYFVSNGFYKMLKKDYPKPAEAIASLRAREVNSVAVSQWFAYSWEDGHRISVFFQARLVGYLDNNDRVHLLPDRAVSYVMKQARTIGVIKE